MQPHQVFFIKLRFYATGSFQQTVADHCGISKTSAQGAITLASHHLALLRPDIITFPRTEQQRLKKQEGFKPSSKVPRVIGAMDCTYVKNMSPGEEDGEIFRNRNGFSHSMGKYCVIANCEFWKLLPGDQVSSMTPEFSAVHASTIDWKRVNSEPEKGTLTLLRYVFGPGREVYGVN